MTHLAALPRNIRRPRFWWLQGCFKVASRSPPMLLQCWIMLAKRIVGLCGVRARGSNSLAFADHKRCLILLPCGHRLKNGGTTKKAAHQTRRRQRWTRQLLRRRIAKTAPRQRQRQNGWQQKKAAARQLLRTRNNLSRQVWMKAKKAQGARLHRLHLGIPRISEEARREMSHGKSSRGIPRIAPRKRTQHRIVGGSQLLPGTRGRVRPMVTRATNKREPP